MTPKQFEFVLYSKFVTVWVFLWYNSTLLRSLDMSVSYSWFIYTISQQKITYMWLTYNHISHQQRKEHKERHALYVCMLCRCDSPPADNKDRPWQETKMVYPCSLFSLIHQSNILYIIFFSKKVSLRRMFSVCENSFTEFAVGAGRTPLPSLY